MRNTLKSLATTEQLNAVLTHPVHQWSLNTLVRLIYQLRAARTDAELYDLQRELLRVLLETETQRASVSRVRKRMRNGQAPPANSPELQSGLDPRQLESWELEYVVYERVCRQLRTIGDALAWRAFGFERSHIVALSRGEPAGPMAGKAGLTAEIEFVDACWHDGKFALMHDLTSQLRIGDATVFDEDSYSLHEIKTNEQHRDAVQDRRLVAAANSIARNEPLVRDGQILVSVDTPYRTHLDVLRAGLNLAHERGMQGIRVPGSRSVMAASLYTAANHWSEQEFGTEFERRFKSYRRKAGIRFDDHKLVLSSLDLAARNPTAPPWAIYPVAPELAALLITDSVFFYSAMAPDAVITGLADHGVEARWLQPLDGNEQVGMPLIQVTMFRSRTSAQTTSLNLSEVTRLLLELVDLKVWCQHVAAVLREQPAGISPWPYFATEWKTWA